MNSQGAGTTYRNILRPFEVEPSLPAAVEENLSCQRRDPCVRQIFGQSPRCGSGPTPVFIVFIYFFPPLVTLRPFSRNIGMFSAISPDMALKATQVVQAEEFGDLCQEWKLVWRVWRVWRRISTSPAHWMFFLGYLNSLNSLFVCHGVTESSRFERLHHISRTVAGRRPLVRSGSHPPQVATPTSAMQL